MLNTFVSRLRVPLNPLTLHELRSLMRSPRAYSYLTVYMSIVSGITLLIYVAASFNGSSGVNDSSRVGTILFYIVVGMQAIVVSFLTPSFTSGAISGERENDTYELLRITSITPRQIVAAKLTAAFGFSTLLVFATLPLLSLALLLGGVELVQAAAAIGVVLASALFFSALGIYISSRSASRLSSAIITYVVTTGIVLGMAVFMLVVFPLINDIIYGTSSLIKTSPVLGILLQILVFFLMSASPISALVASETNLQESGNIWYITINQAAGATPPLYLPAPFIILIVLYLLLSALFLWFTIRRLDAPIDSL